MLLDVEPDMDVVGETGDGAQAFALAVQLRPDVVLADISMPPPDGIELARQLRLALPETKIVIVSMHDDAAIVKDALSAGAAGYVTKHSVGRELLNAIHTVAAGGRYLDPSLAW